MSETALRARVRTEKGKQAAKRIRREGLVPGVYYFHGQDPVTFSVDAKEFRGVLAQESSILDVQFDQGEATKCVIREVQWDPVTSAPIHVDLMGVRLTEKVTVEVPIHLTGTAAGVKSGGVLQHLLRELEIECLPLDIPPAINVDVTNLDIHDSIHVRDLKLEKVEIHADPDLAIVMILPPRVEEAVVPLVAEEEAEEPEVISHGKPEEQQAEEGEQKK